MFRRPFGVFKYNWNGLLSSVLFLWDWRNKPHPVSVMHSVLQRQCTETLLFYWHVWQRVSSGRETKGEEPSAGHRLENRQWWEESGETWRHLLLFLMFGWEQFHEKMSHIVKEMIFQGSWEFALKKKGEEAAQRGDSRSLGLCMIRVVDKRSERQWRSLAKQCVWGEGASGRRPASSTPTAQEHPDLNCRLLRKKGGSMEDMELLFF